MIHILSGGQFGMPGDEGGSSFDDAVDNDQNGEGGRANECIAEDNVPLISLQGGRQGYGDRDTNSSSNSSSNFNGDDRSSGNERESRKRAQRSRLAAGISCLWSGIGVGAMLCGQTAEATTHYAEYAREAIKGCYDEVSEEVRVFVCVLGRRQQQHFRGLSSGPSGLGLSRRSREQGSVVKCRPTRFLCSSCERSSSFVFLAGHIFVLS